ncbi:MAG: metallo-beta-lactamase family protein [Novosphingobium sp.]|nr:metallo-beta-lactamase family protein [Novosphingobium sp.]
MQFEVLPVTRYAMNCSILWCEETGRAAVIDPGGDIDKILNFIELMDLVPEVALVTHGHFDHCGGAARFARLTGARIEGPHRGDETAVRSIKEQGKLRSIPAEPFEPSRWLEDGDIVSFGNVTLNVMHCPGHSPGHVAYYNSEKRYAFVGDILFRGAIGSWEHRDGDLTKLVDSIRHRLFPLGDDVGFVPGHGSGSTFGRERAENPFVGDEAYALWCCQRDGRS